MMAAPPLPPRISGIQLWTSFQSETNIQTSSGGLELQRTMDCSISHHVLGKRGVSPPPPLPPRRWVGQTAEEFNELLLVPPPPSQAVFKDPSSDLISFSGPLNLNQLTLRELTSRGSTASSSAPRPITNGLTKPNGAVPPNSPSWPAPAFSNGLYFQNGTQLDNVSTTPVGQCSSSVKVSFPHSHSAPDLAQLQTLKTDEGQKAMLDSVIRCMKKKRDSNLIDLFSHDDAFAEQLFRKGVRKGKDDILELFDPLAEVQEEVPSPVPSPVPPEMHEEVVAVDEDVVDRSGFPEKVPLRSSTIRTSPVKSGTNQTYSGKQEFGKLRVTPRTVTVPLEYVHFAEEVRKLRRDFPYDEDRTNVGLVVSPILENNKEDALSIQLVINSVFADPVSFTCDVNTTIEHIILHSVCTVFDDTSGIDMENYVLKVKGIMEYLTADSCLADYEYVHQCQKYDTPVYLTLVETKDLDKHLARTVGDDKRDVGFSPDDLLDDEAGTTIHHNSVNILLETIHGQVEKFRQQARLKNDLIPLLTGVEQAIKALCASLSRIETIELSLAIGNLKLAVLNFTKFCMDSHRTDEESSMLYRLDQALLHVLECIEKLIDMYCCAYRVNFHVPKIRIDSGDCRDATLFLDTLLVQLGSLHQFPPHWTTTYQSIMVKSELKHGKYTTCMVTSNKAINITKSLFHWVCFDEWLSYDSVPMCSLQRESTLYFYVYGVKANESGLPGTQLLGWTGMSVFDHRKRLCQGSYLLGLWSEDVSPKSGPAVANHDSSAIILNVTFPEYDFQVQFPGVSSIDIQVPRNGKFDMLDEKTRNKILRIVGSDLTGLVSEEEKELLWEKRHFLKSIPQALPKLLFSVSGWDWACLPEIYSALRDWQPLSPVEALVLLLPDFPDVEVRSQAVKWIKGIGSDELCDYLPQLVQTLRFETWLDSSVVNFLLERSLTSVRVAHNLYWLLKQDLRDPLTGRRIRSVLNALKVIVGGAMREMFQRQGLLLGSLSAAAERVKTTKESLRLSALFQELDTTRHILQENPTCLPLSPSLQVCSVDVKDCGYFTSNTLPLRIWFKCAGDEDHSFAAIYKVGDDLRQDMLTLQMIRIMDKIWLKEGLDLKIVTFGCFATAYKEGVVEMVLEAETLRKIQTEHGLTGSFKDRPIAEWLQKHNTSELEYQTAVDNFTVSCAGYCVATYILGICDRHNDNIMLKNSGHMFHIDFGKFLGDSQMFGNIKRDRVPFVLTSDMAYVINGGDKPSKRFQDFIDVCCQAFNILRKKSSVFLNLFALMSESGVPGLNTDAVMYVEKALLPYLSDVEAAAHFTKLVEDSLRSWSTQFNFFIHNLAQLRFTGDHGDESLLSFIPKTFTKESDGKITDIAVVSCQKRYDPEKYYVYQVRVEREGQTEPMCVYRSYPEFCEFHQKLGMLFPLAKFQALPRGSFVSRTNVREVAEKRRDSLSKFMQTLLGMAQEIAHCPLLYTFLHPVLRDQEGIPQAWFKNTTTELDGRSSPVVRGNVKLSVHYRNNSLFIMIMHAKNLGTKPGENPDSYVKTYLVPDPHKLTKRKTKVVTKNAHPTFMEMLVYRLPYEVVRRRTLSVSVWNHDRVQENRFLGATSIDLEDLDLKVETSHWYPLYSERQSI